MSLKYTILKELENRFYNVDFGAKEKEYEFDITDYSVYAKCPYRAIHLAILKNYINVDSINGEFVDSSEDSIDEMYNLYSPDDIIDFIQGGMII